jgi:hypothetical protein
MPLLTDAVRRYIGLHTGPIEASEPVEKGEVRRFAQAIMDEKQRYAAAEPGDRFGGPVAPPLFPALMFRRPLGAPDPFINASEPDFDGLSLATHTGLPDLPLHNRALVSAGVETEFYRYARHGELVTQQSVYRDIYERQSKQGEPLLFTVIDSEFRTSDGELLLRFSYRYVRR